MLNIRFNDEAYEIAAHILNNTFPGGGGIKGYNVDIEQEDGSVETFNIVGANQLDDEDEIKLVVRKMDPETGLGTGPEIRLSWDTTIEVC